MELFDHHIGHLVRRTHRAHDMIFARETRGLNVTSPQFAAMVVIAEQPGIDQMSLSEGIAFDRTTIVGMIDRLVQKGLVSRSIGPDRRTRTLELTLQGEALLADIKPRATRVSERLLAPLDHVEREHLISMLRRLLPTVESGASEESPNANVA
jgi:MarR family transcriptional regulator, temperature-dependent positive regulator of motility